MTRRKVGILSSSALSSAYDEALGEMQSDAPDVMKAYRGLKKAYDFGDARAAFALATWYIHGQPPVVDANLATAISLIKEAAAAGNADALVELGAFYERGEDGSPNLKLAFQTFVTAAIRGQSQAIYEVGRCYHFGIGVRVDRDLAKIWLARAEELGIRE